MINGKLLVILGVQIVLTHGQPFFAPMAGQFGLQLEPYGAATGYAGGGVGIPLLSPLELNAIMEAQAKAGNLKTAFTPNTQPQGFAGYSNNEYMPNFEEGFDNEGNSEFYESPRHGDGFPDPDSVDKEPETKGRDSRSHYSKDDSEEDLQKPSHGRSGYQSKHGFSEESNSQGGFTPQRGNSRDEETGSAEPASGGAYREHRGEGGSAEGPEESEGVEGGPEPYSGGAEGERYRDDEPPENYRDHTAAFQEDRDYGGSGEPAYEPKETPNTRLSGKKGNSASPNVANRRPVMDNAGGYSPNLYQDDSRIRVQPSAYRPHPNAGYFPGRIAAATSFIPQGYPLPQVRSFHPNYAGYKVFNG